MEIPMKISEIKRWCDLPIEITNHSQRTSTFIQNKNFFSDFSRRCHKCKKDMKYIRLFQPRISRENMKKKIFLNEMAVEVFLHTLHVGLLSIKLKKYNILNKSKETMLMVGYFSVKFC